MAAAYDEEAELMLKVAADVPSAFEALVGRVLPRLLGFFRHLGADRTQAEDLAQDVFLKLYRGRKTYTQRARFTTYLLHVARNHWIDFYRHRRLGPTVISTDAPASRLDDGGDSLGASLPGPSPDPARGAEQGQLRAGLGQALAQLEDGQREVFVLAHVHGLRYEEIAAVLEIPVGTVKSRVHTATRLLRKALERLGIEP